MVTVLVDDKYEVDFADLLLTRRLSGVDSCSITIYPRLGHEGLVFKAILENKYVTIKEGSKIIFSGFCPLDSELEWNRSAIPINLVNKAYNLKNHRLYYDYKAVDLGVEDFLNSNPAGLAFQNYNIRSNNLIFSRDFSPSDWQSVLNDTVNSLDIYYWYDYNFDRVMIGKPDKPNVVNRDTITNKYRFSNKIKVDKSKMVNRYIVKSGGIKSVSLFDTPWNIQVLNGYTVQSKTDTKTGKTVYYIQDENSAIQYGIIEDELNLVEIKSQDLTTAAKQQAATVLHTLASIDLKSNSRPFVTLPNFQIYQTDIKYSEYVDVTNVFNVDFVVNPDDKFSYVIKDQFLLADISYQINGNSSDQWVNCTLVNYIPRKGRLQSLITALQSQLKTSTGYASQQSLSLNTTVSSFEKGYVDYSIDTKFKQITRFEISFTLLLSSGTDTILSNFYLDGVNLTQYLGKMYTNGTKRVKYPSSSNLNILALGLDETDLNNILNNKAGNIHTIEMRGVEGSGTVNVITDIIIEGESNS